MIRWDKRTAGGGKKWPYGEEGEEKQSVAKMLEGGNGEWG